MQKTASISINLAKNRGESFVDRFIRFALSIGRVLVIITELIALGAFLYRFTLDQTLVGLHDAITQQEAVVNLLHNNEVIFRNLQDRLALASSLMQQNNQQPQYLIDVSSFAPADMSIESVSVAIDAIRVEATVQSVDSLTTFVNKLKAYAPVTAVSIDRISTNTQTGTISVSITATLKQPKNILQNSVNTPGQSQQTQL